MTSRQVLPDHRGDLAAAVARRVDDVFGLDHAAGGLEPPAAVGQLPDAEHAGVPVNRGATLARPLGERLRQLRRIDVAVARIPQRGTDAVELEKRMARADLRRRQQLEFDPLGARLRDHVPELVHPLGAVRQAQAAGLVIVDLVADFLRQPCVQRGRVALQPENAPGGGEVRTVAGRVPGGARGEFVALEQDHVGPAEAREVVQRAAADRAAPDDDHPRVALQGRTHAASRARHRGRIPTA